MKENRHPLRRCRRNHHTRSMSCTNHRIDLLLGKNTLNSKRIGLVGVDPGVGGLEDVEDALVEGGVGCCSCDADVDVVGFAVGGHVDDAEAAAGESWVYAEDAGCARYACWVGGVRARGVVRGGHLVFVLFGFEFCHDGFGDVCVGVDVLDVVEFFEGVC